MFKEIRPKDFFVVPFTNETLMVFTGTYDSAAGSKIYIEQKYTSNNVVLYDTSNKDSKFQYVKYFAPTSGNDLEMYTENDDTLYYSASSGFYMDTYDSTESIFYTIKQEFEKRKYDPNYNLYTTSGTSETIYWISGTENFKVIDIPTMLIGDEIKKDSFQYSYTYNSQDRILYDDEYNRVYHSGSADGIKWVGSIFRDKGIIAIPNIPMDGTNSSSYPSDYFDPTDATTKSNGILQYSSRFTQYTQILNIHIKANEFNKTQNNTMYDNNDKQIADFVVIDTVNLYDENYDLMGQATLSAPILHRGKQDILFRIKYDV